MERVRIIVTIILLVIKDNKDTYIVVFDGFINILLRDFMSRTNLFIWFEHVWMCTKQLKC